MEQTLPGESLPCPYCFVLTRDWRTRMYLVNSPVVRGENLRFRESGVRDVVSTLLLPWINAFRFFLNQAALYEANTGRAFVFNPAFPTPVNVMDRWILARCQSLIGDVRSEMAAYKLYTITPRLSSLVDELTNWYIRFNRSRLKGDHGQEEAAGALNTLFETLFTLCRTMVWNIYGVFFSLLPLSRLPTRRSSQSISTRA